MGKIPIKSYIDSVPKNTLLLQIMRCSSGDKNPATLEEIQEVRKPPPACLAALSKIKEGMSLTFQSLFEKGTISDSHTLINSFCRFISIEYAIEPNKRICNKTYKKKHQTDVYKLDNNEGKPL